MKKIILLITLLTANAASAAANEWFSHKSTSCETGAQLQGEISAEEKNVKYKISEDLTQLTVDQDSEEEGDEVEVTDAQVYNLRQVGKVDFMAFPQSDSGNTPDSYFIVSTDATLSSLTVSTLDRTGSRCNGGLILTSLVK